MTDALLIALVLGALYLLECFEFAPSHSSIVISRGLRNGHILRPLIRLAGIRRNLFFCNPLDLLALHVIVPNGMVRKADRSTLCVLDAYALPTDANLVQLTLSNNSEETLARVRAALYDRLGSPADFWIRSLERRTGRSADDLVTTQRRLRRDWRIALSRVELLQSLCIVQTFTLLLILPLFLLTAGLLKGMIAVAPVAIVIHLAIIVSLIQLRKKLLRESSREAALQILPLLLFPPGVLRSAQRLAHHRLAAYDQREILAELVDRRWAIAALTREARLFLYAFRFEHVARPDSQLDLSAWQRFRKSELKHISSILLYLDSSLRQAISQSRPQGARPYCPVCLTGFEFDVVNCPDCNGIPLRRSRTAAGSLREEGISEKR